MKVLINNTERDRIINSLRQKVEKERKGIHITDLIYCLRKAYFRKILNIPPTEEQVLYYATGLFYHNLFEENLREIEIELDGITGTLDCIGFIDDTTIPVEIKTTRISSNKDILDMKHWLIQLKGYAKLIGSSRARLIVLHLVGDWKNPSPQLLCYDFEFTREEIDENWSWLISRRDILLDALDKGILPSIETRFAEWECEKQVCECYDVCKSC